MSKSPIQGQEYRSAFTLYSEDGKRAADVLEFRNGETYLDEQEWVEGTTFKNSIPVGWSVRSLRQQTQKNS
jgi:hypothetical protein